MTPVTALAVLTGVLGLAVGSFLNVVIYRVPARLSVVSPGSHCPGCDTPIKGRHNVPVIGWLVLRGRCASCDEPISARYPLVEAATGALFVALTLHFGLDPVLPAYLYLAAVGVTLAMIAFDTRWLPDAIVLPSYVVAIALLMPAAALHDGWHDAWHGLVGMAAFLGLFGALAVATAVGRGAGVGLGEVKLAGLVGLVVGYLSWSALLVTAVVTLAVLGVATAARTARHRGSLPAGTCLLAASALALFVTAPLVSFCTAFAST